jgi:uncharacterized repeat protein (TIGR02543 family)
VTACLTNGGGGSSGVTSSALDAYASGGGVYVTGTFTMHNGTISGNTASSDSGTAYGGGVYVNNNGTFTMHNGEIFGNTASGSSYGGGVYVYYYNSSSYGTFRIVNGTVYGSEDSVDTSLKNTAANGAALYSNSINASQHGRFDGTDGAWNSVGTLSTFDNTFLVIDGELQSGDIRTVTFNANNGTPAPAQQIITYGGKAAEPAAMTRAGYTFAGWYKESNFTNQWDFATDTVNSHRYLYAKWIYTVTYDLNGGIGTTPAVQTVNAGTYNVTLAASAGITRGAYTFAGWNTKADGTGTNYDANAAVNLYNGSITLYARWTSTVTYDLNGATSGTTPAAQTVNAGASVTLASGSYIYRDTYTFDGWNTEADGTGSNYYSYTPTGNITLYARWIYVVNFSANGGSGWVSSVNVQPGSGITLPSGDGLTRTGYAFTGWNTEADGTGTDYTPGEPYTPTAITTLYAQWIAAYTVTFNANSGTPAPAQQAVLNGGKAAEPAAMTRGAYSFAGWYKESGFTNQWDFAADTVIGSITLYARWTSTVTYNINGATSEATPAAQTVNAGVSVTLAASTGITKTNYTFGGWNTSADGTGTNYSAGSSYTPAGNITLYAKWIYAVTFNANGGSGTVPDSVAVFPGSGIILPSGDGLSKSGNLFGGWNTNSAGTGTNYNVGTSYTPTGTITLYAKWNTDPNPNINITITNTAEWNAAVNRTKNASGNYTFIIDGSFSISPSANNTFGSGVTVTLTTAYSTARTITLNNNGNLLRIGSNQTVIISSSNLTLQGRDGNSGSLVDIDGGILKLYGGTISGNTANVSGGGVFVYNGTFTMEGGTISGNTANRNGGGVYVYSGTFTMNGGTIYNNTATTSGNYSSNGGGVYVNGNGAFTMNGGTIYNNTSSSTSPYSSSYGGGVSVSVNGAFTMNGGTIYGNDVYDASNSDSFRGYGGGVYVNDQGTFTMSSGTISFNQIFSGWLGEGGGGGVYVASNGTFTMEGGNISSNRAVRGHGGGVSNLGTFTMEGGIISGNTTTRYTFSTAVGGLGGGVYAPRTFTMSGGTIYGTGEGANSNIAEDNGAALYGRGTYNDGTNILPHTDGNSSYTNNTIIGRQNVVTVTFNANGGTGAPAAQTITNGSGITLPDGDGLTRTGYTFVDWNTNANGTGTNYSAGSSYTPAGNSTLYARWTSTVTFNANNATSGSAPAAQTVSSGSAITLPSGGGLSKSGCTFGGWNINANGTGTNYSADSSYTPAGNITLYARWLNGTETDPFPLTANTWADGSITSTASGSAVWYSFNVTSGTTYYVWWNDQKQGNSTKTLDVSVSAKYSSGTSIFTSVDSGWASARSFTANTTGMVKIKVEPYSSGNTGTFTVAYTTSSTRPWAPELGAESNPILLTANTWADGSITSTASGTAVWYSFNVTSGTTYYVWWNGGYSGYGNGTKTLDIKASAYYSNGTAIFTGINQGWTSPRSFTANTSGTVKIKVEPFSSGSTGTFAVAYRTTNTRP